MAKVKISRRGQQILDIRIFWKFKLFKLIFNYYNYLSLMAQTQKAAGSIWNVNSWHWEMKNYTQLTKKILQQKFLNLVFQASNSIKISHSKIKFPKAEAEVNIRKGKQILIYDFQLELDVIAESDQQQSKGSYRIKEILSDDLTDMVFEDIKASEKNKCGEQIKKWIKKNAKERVIAVFKEMQADLQKLESDPKKLEEDQKRREEAMKFTQKAKQEKGQQKQRLFQEQKEKERKMKEQAYKKHFQKGA